MAPCSGRLFETIFLPFQAILLATVVAMPAAAQIGSTRPEIQEGSVGLGDPQALQLRLSDAQRKEIVQAVRQEDRPIVTPPKFSAAIGAQVPPAIELHLLPDAVLANVPDAKRVKYTRFNNQVILVDPTNMRIVDLIPM